ncbi:MAG: tail fiber domain-containing protein [Ignavibacteria bacterium]|jgi:polyhydroxyalkanoate synthesis regulator phasin|nr:tail fiber domain-containing protein [Ignavibacteria bacterium]
MKHHLIIFILFILPSIAVSQPDYINFQAVIRDGSGKLITNKQISVQLKLFKGTDTFLVERHIVTTNANGIATMAIGTGNNSKGNFKNIDWTNGPDSIRVRYDKNGGSTYVDVGTSQLLSVPYALVAKTATDVPHYTAGTGIGIVNEQIINMKPDLDLSLTAGNGIKITGKYPSFMIENTAGSGASPYTPGDGISISNNQITNTKPDKTVILNAGQGISITGTYPQFTISSGGTSSSAGLNAIDSTSVLIKGALRPASNYYDSNFNAKGARMLWLSGKAAFRAGWVGDDSENNISGKIWDCDSIACYSVAFGNNNIAKGFQSFAVGKNNRSVSENSFTAGYGNVASALNSTTFGSNNNVSGNNSFANGVENFITSQHSFANGFANALESGTNSFASGTNNIVTGNSSAALGADNNISSDASFTAGSGNVVSGDASFAFGLNSKATATTAIAIGDAATASGEASVAIGRKSNTNDKAGAFVFSDSHINDLSASADDQMTMRFTGGYRLFTNLSNGGVVLTSNAWATASDSTLKENFIFADGNYFLQKIANMRLGSWNYKGESPKEMRHYGAMAQDIFSAFGKDAFGTIGNSTNINSADMDGIMMIAIKELIQQNNAKQQEIETLRNELEELKSAVKELQNK